MAEISLRNVRKSFGRTEVIHGVSIDIADGELIVIVGPSGCGKSTLLRMVAGLEDITAGEVSIGGRVVNALEPRERDIAMVFQNYALYPHMSVFDNMAYGLKIARMPKAEIRARVAKAARMLELEPFLKRKPRELSGGQRQRVAMGRAVVREPAAFLFDEPLSNLDAKLRVAMRIEIRALQRQLGVTSLYVTHDQVEAMTLADRMVVMNAGIAEQVGPPLEVYERPASTFVAGFIGSPPMNFLPAQLVPADGPLGTRLAGLPKRDPVTIAVRPEHLVFAPAGQGAFLAHVRLAETLGAETFVHLSLSDGTGIVARREGGSEIPPVGAQVGLSCEARNLHLFDADGKRIDVGPV